MNRTQADRSVIATRAAANGRNGRNHGVLAPSNPASIGYVRRSSAVKMTKAQRNSQGRFSEWAMSQNNRDGRDPKWDATVTSGAA